MSGKDVQPTGAVVQGTGAALFPKFGTIPDAEVPGSSISNNASERLLPALVDRIRLVIACGMVNVKFTVGAAVLLVVLMVPPVHVINRSLTRSVLLSARIVVFKLLRLHVIVAVCALASPANNASTANAITYLRNAAISFSL